MVYTVNINESLQINDNNTNKLKRIKNLVVYFKAKKVKLLLHFLYFRIIGNNPIRTSTFCISMSVCFVEIKYFVYFLNIFYNFSLNPKHIFTNVSLLFEKCVPKKRNNDSKY